jgi:hypothetical protein
MTDDLVERLRLIGLCSRIEDGAGCVCGGDTPDIRAGCGFFVKRPIGPEAADRIEAQDKLIEVLREGLERIAAEAYVPIDECMPHGKVNGWRNVAVERIDIARDLLASIKEPGA